MRKPQDYQVGITSKKQEKLNKQVYRQSGQEAKDLKKAREAKRTGEVQESFIWGTLLNMTTYMVIFFLLLFGSSITLYQSQPERYSWLDSNGDFKTETYDVTVSYNLDTPLNELNGNSLNDVFLDGNDLINGDFSNGYTGWYDTSASVSVVNGRAEVTADTQFPRIYQFTMTPYKSYWYRAEVEYSVNGYWNNIPKIRSTFNNFDVYSGYAVAGELIVLHGINQLVNENVLRIDIYGSVGDVVYIDNCFGINLTDLGLTDLTSDDMEYWYSEYQRLQENRIEDMKYLGGEVVSSWYTTTQILMQIGDVIETIYDNSPVSWIIDLFADIGV